ncbi:hypothetical protein JCM16303_005910 [Sporobolomyces ruberrimus]
MYHTPDPPDELDRPISRNQLPHPSSFNSEPPLPSSLAPHYHHHLSSQLAPRPQSRSASPFPEHMQQYAPPPPPPPPSSQQRLNHTIQRSHSPYNNNPQQQLQVQDTRTQLFVSNLPFRVRWQDLKDLMRKCGTVLRADVALSPTDGRSRGFGVVLFARAEDAAKAIGVYHGYTWQTRVLDVRIDSQDPTGALALAEANRQQSIQQQREVYQNLASRLNNGGSMLPVNLPPPPPITQPLQHYNSNGGYHHPPPPPPLSQQQQQMNSPYYGGTSSSSSPVPSHLQQQQLHPHLAPPPHFQSHSPAPPSSSTTTSNEPQSRSSPFLVPSPQNPQSLLLSSTSTSGSTRPNSSSGGGGGSNSPSRHSTSSTHSQSQPPSLQQHEPSSSSTSRSPSIPLSPSSSIGPGGDTSSNHSNQTTTMNSSPVPPPLSLDHSKPSPPPRQQQQQQQQQQFSYHPPPPPNPSSQSNYPQPPLPPTTTTTMTNNQSIVPGGLMNFYNNNNNNNSNNMNGMMMNNGGMNGSSRGGGPLPPPLQQKYGPGPGPGPGPMGMSMGMSPYQGGGGPGGGQGGGQGGPGQGGGPNGIGYTNRHLFIGNLPFNCQWQELKDLMRGAGSVLRADIAQGPDGRSRGFGSVLFATSIDAERAVQLFNGHEFQGRTLKVHFDKFSGQGMGQPGSNYPGAGPSNGSAYGNGPMGGGYRQDGPQYPPYAQGPPPSSISHQFSQQQQRDSNPRQPLSNYPPSRQQAPQQQSQYQYGLSSAFANSPMFQGLGETVQRDSGSSSSRPGTAQAPIGSPSPSMQARQTPAALSNQSSSRQDETDSDPRSRSENAPSSSNHDNEEEDAKPVTKTSPSLLRQNAAAPSRIAMPPPLPFSSSNGGPFSPMRANLPPMTPSMPAFTFGGFSAPTPPVHPHALFSPGIGPFSPQIGSPFFGPGAQQMNHFQTVAPGAPSPGFGFNPMFPAFPPTPGGVHPVQQSMQQQQQQQNGYPINGNYAYSNGNNNMSGGDHPTPLASQAPNTLEGDASYFPQQQLKQGEYDPESTTNTREREETVTYSSSSNRHAPPPPLPPPLESASAPPLSPQLSPSSDRVNVPGVEYLDGRPRLTGHSVSDTLAIDLAQRMRLEQEEQGHELRNSGEGGVPTKNHHRRSSSVVVVGGVIAQPGWAEEEVEIEDPSSSNNDYAIESGGEGEKDERFLGGGGRGQGNLNKERRRSFVPPSSETGQANAETAGGGGSVSGGSPGKLRVGDNGNSGGARRASFEDSTRSRPAFGTSIWG